MAYRKKPLIAEIKRNSLDDGPGIRSVVFFKGCVLNCVWCHNPECISPAPELMQLTDNCIACGECIEVCPQHALTLGNTAIVDREKCDLCGDCAQDCPAEALKLVGYKIGAKELATELAEDLPFYRNSGGGVTLSGGEPTLYLDYCADLARQLKAQEIHICLETCGYFDWNLFEKKLLPLLDLVYIDLKLFDATEHNKYAGKPNKRILDNIERLVKSSATDFLVRLPLIPGVNTAEENLRDSAGWLRSVGVNRVALLPYNPLWLNKAAGVGRSTAYNRDTFLDEDEERRIIEIFAGFEIE